MFTAPLGKPKGKFVRVHPTLTRKVKLFCYKPEGEYQEELYLITEEMLPHMADDARPAILVPYVDRAGSPGVWPLKLAKLDEGEKPVVAWSTAIQSAKRCREVWAKVVWRGRAYETKNAHPKYAADPDWSKLPDFDGLIAAAFGQHRIIKDKTHPIYCDHIAGTPSDDFEGDEPDGDALE
jgi:hypothetical protein